jgi:hypothetical protein
MNTPANRFTPPASVTARIARLLQLPMAEIKALWRELYGRENPTHNRQFLERRIAYKLQENAFRTVDQSQLLERNARHIQALIETGKAPKRDRELRLLPGTVLTREYLGVEHLRAVCRRWAMTSRTGTSSNASSHSAHQPGWSRSSASTG